MERVETLINKLKFQLDEKADVSKLLITAQMLLAELQNETNAISISQGKVSVLLPKVHVANNLSIDTKQQPPQQLPSSLNEEKIQSLPKENNWLADALISIPTLAHQEPKEIYELNDSTNKTELSFNDKLKEDKVEIASALNDSPVRDLKKAIGINDRYLFTNELFRGDETMYERSIKTINAFSIYPEAEYWIQRELKVKLGWSDENETVKLFDQIVRRRFN